MHQSARITRKMRSSVLSIFLCVISISNGFLQYPFLANDLVDDFLSTLDNDRSTIKLENMTSGHLCNRECKENDVRVCRFHFMMKYFQAMGG